MKFCQVIKVDEIFKLISFLTFVGGLVSAGSDKMSPAHLVKSAYDFSQSAECRANLSAFSSPEPVSTFIFGIDKDPDFPQAAIATKPSMEETYPINSQLNRSSKPVESSRTEPLTPPPVEVKFFDILCCSHV